MVVTSACNVDCFAFCVTFPHEIASLTHTDAGIKLTKLEIETEEEETYCLQKKDSKVSCYLLSKKIFVDLMMEVLEGKMSELDISLPLMRMQLNNKETL